MNDIDFKAQLEADSKLAKHILGIANYGGGTIVLGVKQENDGSLEYVGVTHIVDKADITIKLSAFIPSNLNYDVHEFVFEGSEYEKPQHKKFQILIIPDTPSDLPFFAKKTEKILKRMTYITGMVQTP